MNHKSHVSRRAVIAATCGLSASSLAQPILANSPTPYHAPEFMDLGAVSIRFKLEGRGTALVVLLHEMGMSLEGWDYVAPELAKTCRILRYDLRGFGLSEKIVDEVRWDEHLQDLAQLLTHVSAAKPTFLVGAALGGAIAQKYAASFPNSIRAVAALAPALGGTPASRPGSKEAALRNQGGASVGFRAYR
jgi:3-oxoadipate enol-lactonase